MQEINARLIRNDGRFGVFRIGLKSASVTGFDGRKCPEYLHTRYDTADNTSEFCIANTFEICCALVEKLDGEQN